MSLSFTLHQNFDGVVLITANFQSPCCALEFVVWSPWIHLLLIVLVLHSSFRVEQKYGNVIIIKILQNDVVYFIK